MARTFTLKSVVAAFISCILPGLPSFTVHQDDPLAKIERSLGQWSKTHPQEKVYLHLDKPYYALGDTIWFKAYITVGSRHQLSALSGALYADLINGQGLIEKTLKLPVVAGTTVGDFTLPDTLAEGNYRIRAYTQWMRNAGEDYFFDRTITVGNPFEKELVTKATYVHTGGDKPLVTARLSFADGQGKALQGKKVNYRLMPLLSQNGFKQAVTDAAGMISIQLPAKQLAGVQGAYIETNLPMANKQQFRKNFPVKAGPGQSDVQFFPESGALVEGVTSRVAFKAVGVDGVGVAIKGTVTDGQGNEIAIFESTHAGMGVFSMRPQSGAAYQAQITYADGSKATVNLPKAQSEGLVLSVYQTVKDSVLVRVSASPGNYTPARSVYLAVQSGGEMLTAAQIKVSKPQTSVLLPSGDFPGGISQFTIFSETGEPLNERIAFINNADRMQLAISTTKQSYGPREKIDVTLDAKNRLGSPTAGSFSVAVINESRLPADEAAERTILTDLLLTSDLKGYIEKPNYYFSGDEPDRLKALDNLMLTQGFRRFAWKPLLAGSIAKPEFPAEKITTQISGKVLSFGGKPMANGKVTLLSLKGGIMRDTVTNAQGRFNFGGILLTDSIKFTVQARTPKNGKAAEIVMDDFAGQALNANPNTGDINTDIAGSTKTYLESTLKELEQSGMINRMQYLKEVSIKARPVANTALQGMLAIPAGHADQTLVPDQPELISNLGIYLQGKLQGVIFRPQGAVQNYPFQAGGRGEMPVRVIFNGRVLNSEPEIADVFDTNVIDPKDIARIEVVRTNQALLNYLGGPSLIVVTKKNYVIGKKYYNVANINPKGFNKTRQFYSQKYETDQARQQADIRSTVYWNPALKTGTDGKATFSFYNTDDPGDYKMIIEGINAAGEPGRQVYRYKVE